MLDLEYIQRKYHVPKSDKILSNSRNNLTLTQISINHSIIDYYSKFSVKFQINGLVD